VARSARPCNTCQPGLLSLALDMVAQCLLVCVWLMRNGVRADVEHERPDDRAL
jgi:hypothetical protein